MGTSRCFAAQHIKLSGTQAHIIHRLHVLVVFLPLLCAVPCLGTGGRSPTDHTLSPAPSDSIVALFTGLGASSPYIVWIGHGASHEGVPLGLAVVSNPEHLGRLDEIRADLVRIGDPRRLMPRGEKERHLEYLPAVVWLSCSVHGDELAPADAACRLGAWLASDTSAVATAIRDSLVVLIDPLRNPDGRARALAQRRQWSSRCSVDDDESYHHREAWPGGRGNHYFIDVNRDAWHLSQPESRSRAEAIVSWNPHVVVDLHEMRADDTYLFSPPRPPSAAFVPRTLDASWDRFSRAIAGAMTRHGLEYYRGDWHEAFAPDRLVAWSLRTGATGILLEVPGVDGTVVRQPDGTSLTYEETVGRHLLVAKTILLTAAHHRRELLAEFRAFREGIVSGEQLSLDSERIPLCGQIEERVEWLRDAFHGSVPGHSAGEIRDERVAPGCCTTMLSGWRAVLLPPCRNETRRRTVAEILMSQGIEMTTTSRSFKDHGAVDSDGKTRGGLSFPAGTYVLDLRQPLGALAATLLAAPTMDEKALLKERLSLLEDGHSTLYSYSAWALPCWADVEVWYSRSSPHAEPLLPDDLSPESIAGILPEPDQPLHALLLDGTDDAALAVALRLLSQGAGLRVMSEPFEVDGERYGPGTVIVPAHGEFPVEAAVQACEAAGATPAPALLGLVDAGPDLGSRSVTPLVAPRVAILSGFGTSSMALGRLWFLFDQGMEWPVSLLPIQRIGRADLTAYNVVIAPDASEDRGGRLRELIGADGWDRLLDWVSFGGTLVLCGESVAAIPPPEQDGEPDIHIALRRDVLDRLPQLAYMVGEDLRSRQLLAGAVQRLGIIPQGHDATSAGDADALPSPLWSIPESALPEELATWDEYLRRFSPCGVFLRLYLPGEHWMTSGLSSGATIPVRSSQVIHAWPPATAIARFSLGNRLCASGLLWPEARERWHGSVAIAREKLGSGQVIALVGDFKRSSPVLDRLVLNAAVLGPSLVSH